jgi:uncharacterized protein (DUF58 family)
LTGRGVIALGAAPVCTVVGLVLGAEEIVLLAIASAAFLLVGYIQCASRLVRARDGWRIDVRLDGTDIQRGQASLLTLVVTAAGRAATVPVRVEDPTLRWEDVTGGAAPSAQPRAPLPSASLTVPLHGSATAGPVALRFGTPTEQRGVFQLRGSRLWCFDGLALFAGLVTTGPSATITVLPVPAPVDLASHLLQGDSGDEQVELLNPRAPRRRHNMGDFAGLRAYVPGDRLRLLYWPALARSGDLLVRDFDDTGERRLRLLADIRTHLGVRGAEAVLATAAGAGLAALRAGTIVEFSTTGGDAVAVGPGPHGDLALLRAIAAVAVEPLPHEHRHRTHRPHAVAGRVESFARADLVVTTAGGANSLPAALRHGHLVIAT